MKKKEGEKENFLQKRKLTSATDPELRIRESQHKQLAPENSPNRKVGTSPPLLVSYKFRCRVVSNSYPTF
jgi:hypothetical protein